jgi:NAD(P)-dependent dehydrogenase (short-subunit alcohol dehydrogenase family)
MLDGKVGIITGATSGIGARTAELFVAEGAKVVCTGRRRAQGEALAARLGAAARFVQADATSEPDWRRVFSETARAFGTRLDYLFNYAGGPAPTGSITGISVAGFDEAMALLVRSVMLGLRSNFVNGADIVVDGGAIRGRNYSERQEGLRRFRATLDM